MLVKLSPAGDGKVTATEKYFLDGNVFQNHHGGFVLVDGYIYGGHGHRPASRSASSSPPAR